MSDTQPLYHLFRKLGYTVASMYQPQQASDGSSHCLQLASLNTASLSFQKPMSVRLNVIAEFID